jgi:hypothetical protein
MKKNWPRATILLLFLIITSGLLFFIINNTNSTQKLSTSTAQFQMNIYLSLEVEDFIANHPYSGTATNPNDSSLQIDVPGDSLEGTDSITSSIYCTDQESILIDNPLPPNRIAISIFCYISFLNSNTDTQITHFDNPVTVTYTYTNDEVEGMDPNSLELYHWDGSQWVLLDNNTVNTTQKTVSGTSQDFSLYAIFGVLGDSGEGVIEIVITPPIPSQPTGGSPIPAINNTVALYRVGDLNSDYLVNLTDFSIAAYWYKRLLSVEFFLIEGRNLNGDGIIDLLDFELMLKKLT